MKKSNLFHDCHVAPFVFLAVMVFSACTENIDESARYVFQYDVALSYLEKHDVYSQYVELVKQTPISPVSNSTVGQLLGTRGHYTVFAPTNEAIDSFLVDLYQRDPTLLSRPSWDAFYSEHKRDSIRKVVVHNSVIDSGDMDDCFMTWDFPTTDKAELALNNMNGVDSIFIMGTAPVSLTERDILVSNGVIHQMERVIAPQDITAASYFMDMLDKKQEGYLVMGKALQACGLMDTLSKIRDEVYEDRYLRG